MTLSEFMALSPDERLNLAPTIARYNKDSTEAFASVIRAINLNGFDSLSPHNMLAFALCICSIPSKDLLLNEREARQGLLKVQHSDKKSPQALASQWARVEDKEPPIGVLILCRDAEEAALCIYDGEDVYEVHTDCKCRLPYWMPIPDLPKGGAQ